MKVFIGILMVLSLAACGSGGVTPEPKKNTDPRQGQVEVTGYVTKVCDGTTLVYERYRGGVSTIPNSPECQA